MRLTVMLKCGLKKKKGKELQLPVKQTQGKKLWQVFLRCFCVVLHSLAEDF